MKHYLTWEEFYQLALDNYCSGGDSVVECWEKKDYDEFGPYTKKEALRSFECFNSVREDIQNS